MTSKTSVRKSLPLSVVVHEFERIVPFEWLSMEDYPFYEASDEPSLSGSSIDLLVSADLKTS